MDRTERGGMDHRFGVRVYYEDTDCMGVVYHANYLRFLERARTEYMASVGTSVAQWAEQDIMFPVYGMQITFKAPARLYDHLTVISTVSRASPFRLNFRQRIERDSDQRQIVEASVDIVCTDLKGNLRDLPASGLEPA